MAEKPKVASGVLQVPLLQQPSDVGSISSMPSGFSPSVSPAQQLSDAMRKEKEAVEKLEDLTGRLQEHGLYDKFLAHREGNRRWRAGKESGAKGEPTARAISEQETEFVKLNPTVSTFTFRRTLAFWIAACYIEGCLLFLWSPLFSLCSSDRTQLRYSLTKGPTFVGGTFFGIGIYLSYLELINLHTDIDNSRVRRLIFNWESMSDGGEVSVWSLVGSILYLVGACCYTLDQISDFQQLTPLQEEYLLEWPLIFGGFCFFLGGCCELVINRSWSPRLTELVWWVSMLNFIGGFCFWTSACPSICPDMIGLTVGEVGTVFYLFAAVMSLFMWQGEQFGGAIMPMLNRALREGGQLRVMKDPQSGVSRIIAATTEASSDSDTESRKDLSDVLNPRLSCRTIVFLCLYLVMGAVQVLSSCMTLADLSNDISRGQGDLWESLNNFITNIGNFTIVVMFLVLSSACVQMPQDEPFHTLVWMLRFMGVILLAQSILTLHVQLELTKLDSPFS